MERADTIGLGQAIVLAPVDGELRRRPLVNEQRRAVLVEDLLAVLVPRAASPLVVELGCEESEEAMGAISERLTKKSSSVE